MIEFQGRSLYTSGKAYGSLVVQGEEAPSVADAFLGKCASITGSGRNYVPGSFFKSNLADARFEII